MSSDHRLSEYVAGLSAALFALIDALDKKNVLTFEDYRANLLRVRDQMPKDEMGDVDGRDAPRHPSVLP